MLFVSQLCEISQNEMRKRFFLVPYLTSNIMYSDRQTNNKPSQVYKKSNNEVMRSYPEYYYKEIVKFLRNSNSYYQ